MAEVVIVYVSIEGEATVADYVPAGSFLKAYDPEAHEGRGEVAWTEDLQEALVFPDLKDAIEAWYAVSKTKPLREDGKPNRPATAISIDIVALHPFGRRTQ